MGEIGPEIPQPPEVVQKPEAPESTINLNQPSTSPEQASNVIVTDNMKPEVEVASPQVPRRKTLDELQTYDPKRGWRWREGVTRAEKKEVKKGIERNREYFNVPYYEKQYKMKQRAKFWREFWEGAEKDGGLIAKVALRLRDSYRSVRNLFRR